MCTLSFSSFSKWIQVALCSVYNVYRGIIRETAIQVQRCPQIAQIAVAKIGKSIDFFGAGLGSFQSGSCRMSLLQRLVDRIKSMEDLEKWWKRMGQIVGNINLQEIGRKLAVVRNGSVMICSQHTLTSSIIQEELESDELAWNVCYPAHLLHL